MTEARCTSPTTLGASKHQVNALSAHGTSAILGLYPPGRLLAAWVPDQWRSRTLCLSLGTQGVIPSIASIVLRYPASFLVSNRSHALEMRAVIVRGEAEPPACVFDLVSYCATTERRFSPVAVSILNNSSDPLLMLLARNMTSSLRNCDSSEERRPISFAFY